MGRRAKDGRAILRPAVPVFKEFKDCTFVRGGTLERYLDKGDGVFWVYTPSARMLGIQCDACVRTHSPKNLECSATIHRESPMQDPGLLYDFKTHAPVAKVPVASISHKLLVAAISVHTLEEPLQLLK